MSDTVYAIASGKGGVGKTTTAINLGAMLADRDHSVVVVDTDLGMANLADFLDFEIKTPTLHEVLAGDADPDEAIYRAPGDIDVLPSATDIEAFVRSDPANLQGVVADLREEYDYVLLDTGAGVSYDTLVPLALADGVLLVATPDVASVRDTAKTGELAERVETEVRGAVLTQRSSDILNADDVEETLGTDVLAVIPQDEAVPMGIDAGRPLASFAPNAPAGQAYQDLAAVLTGEADPDPELETVADTDAESVSDDDPSSESAVAETAGFEMTGGGDSEVEPDDAESDSVESTDDPTASDSIGDDAIDPESGTEGTPDDPLSADAAQNVRDAIGDESGGNIDSLFAGQQADETPDSAEEVLGEKQTADEATADQTSDETTTDQTQADEDGGSPASSELGGGSGARSVDDLINEHISDERLSDDSGGDGDPLAEVSDSGGNAGSDDDDSDPLSTEDPFADETDSSEQSRDVDSSESDETSAESRGTGANSATAQSDGADAESDDFETEADETESKWSGGDDSGGDDPGTVPFENRGRSAQSDAADPTGETRSDEFASEESSEEDDSTDSNLEPDSSDDDESSEDGGVLGRLGSIFR